MGVKIRPGDGRRLFLRNSYRHWDGIPYGTTKTSWRNYGVMPDFMTSKVYGLNLIRTRISEFRVHPFHIMYMYTRQFTSDPLPKYKIRSNSFVNDISRDQTVEHMFGNRTLDMKLRQRISPDGQLAAALKYCRKIRRLELNEKLEGSVGGNTMVYNARIAGVDVADNMTNPTGAIHHFTEEYYLSYLTKYYDFSLTHNDLCSIDKDHIPVLIDMISKYFEQYNDQKLKLRHIELIDHTIHMNDLFLFSFSKVYVQAKINYNTEPKDAYVTEFVAFSKYPKSEEMDKMISELSTMIYQELLKRDLDTNARLVHPDKHPTTDMTFVKLLVGNNNIVRDEKITVRSDNLTNDYYPYLDIEMLIDEYAKSEDKLLILHGENGSGKTKLSNILGVHLYNNNFKVIVCGGADVTNPGLLTELESRVYTSANNAKHICIIIDDIEPQLLNRNINDETVNVFFNKLLLILDGNFDVKLKVIITTNHILKDDSDEPLYRAGRMFDSIYIRYLTKDETKKILKQNGMDTKQVNSFISSKGDSIKQSDIAQYIRMVKNNVSKNYRLDNTSNNIKAKRNKVGFGAK